MDFNLRDVPFSGYGSWLAISQLEGPDTDPLHGGTAPGLWLRHVGGQGDQSVLRLELVTEQLQSVPYQILLEPDTLELRSELGSVHLCLVLANPSQVGNQQPDILRFRSWGRIGLRLTNEESHADSSLIPWRDGRYLLNLLRCRQTYVLVSLQGTLRVDAPWDEKHCVYVKADFLPDGTTGEMEGAFEAWPLAPTPLVYGASFADCQAAAAQSFAAFRVACPAVPVQYSETAYRAAYINWSSVVRPRGLLTRLAMFMSKNWMTGVWAWDHCFNALALSYDGLDMGWDQLMLPFDRQAPNGQIPDKIDDAGMIWNFVKPPVHGWALRYVLRNAPQWAERLAEIYPRLVAWTEWWLRERDPYGHGLAHYHHGNDSGWDNATVFASAPPWVGSDLAGHLALQMDVLSEMAGRLGKHEEAVYWQNRSERMLELLLSALWQDDHFDSPAVSGEVSQGALSLLNCLPIVLGNRLPRSVRQHLIRQIRSHLTPYGLATERPDSSLYEPDGYWRGPIWAPATLLIADGLRSAGEDSLAADIARRFCDLVSGSGFAECFDALSGAPLRDRAFTWTASTFFVLAREFLRDR